MPKKKTRINYSKEPLKTPTSASANEVNYGSRGTPEKRPPSPGVSGGCSIILYWVTIGWIVWLFKKAVFYGTPIFNNVSLWL